MTRPELENVDALTRVLIDEILDHVWMPRWRWLYRLLSRPLWRPFHRFSTLATGFDERVGSLGFRPAIEWFLPNFAASVTIDGKRNVPRSGPVLIAANHPGTVDALAIAAGVPRDDLRILASHIPFLDRLPAMREHLLFTSPDRRERRDAMWAALRHLQAGGAVLMFPRGGLDPDPASMEGAEAGLTDCFGTVEMILRRSPGTRLVLAVVGGVLLPRYVNHPLTRLRRKPRDRQRIAEYVQVIRQVLSAGALRVNTRVSFAPPVTLAGLNGAGVPAGTTAEITRRARALLGSHIAAGPDRSRIGADRTVLAWPSIAGA